MEDRDRCRDCGEKRPADCPEGCARPACCGPAWPAAHPAEGERDRHDVPDTTAEGASPSVVGGDLRRRACWRGWPRPFGHPAGALARHRAGHRPRAGGPAPRRPRCPPRPTARPGSSCSARSPAAAWGSSSRAATPTSAATWPSRSCWRRTATSPELVRRFVEEAQIAGQLQHPGIVPGLRAGRLRRPPALLRHEAGQGPHPGGAARRPRRPGRGPAAASCGIFEQVCQTVAYAHARGVIHRDLKPSNVMVGGFGEVQVMDWGLAKVLPRRRRGRRRPDGRAAPAIETVIRTVRDAAPTPTLSRAGSVLGTPAYMAPEQARGEVDRLDERADVFALGAILCEVLTGGRRTSAATVGEVHAQGREGRPGRRPRPARRLRGRAPSWLALARAAWRRARGPARATPARSPSAMTAYLGRRAGAAAAGRAGRVEAQAGRGRGQAADPGQRAGAEGARRCGRGRAAAATPGGPGRLGPGPDDRRRPGRHGLPPPAQARAAQVELALNETTLLHNQALKAPDDLGRWQAAQGGGQARGGGPRR